MGLGDAGQVSLAVATFSSSTDDPPCITGAVPPPGREVDVIDEADGIDVPRISVLMTSLRSAVGFCVRASRRSVLAPR